MKTLGLILGVELHLKLLPFCISKLPNVLQCLFIVSDLATTRVASNFSGTERLLLLCIDCGAVQNKANWFTSTHVPNVQARGTIIGMTLVYHSHAVIRSTLMPWFRRERAYKYGANRHLISA
jgi:hypothetical protein